MNVDYKYFKVWQNNGLTIFFPEVSPLTHRSERYLFITYGNEGGVFMGIIPIKI